MKQLDEVWGMNPRGQFVHFRSTRDTCRSRTKRIPFIIITLKTFFCVTLRKKRCSEVSSFKVGSSLSFSNLEVPEIIS